MSGGERARLLLARLFSQPANVLVLDEPTNDLDIESLELLESLLVSFSGTLFLVSHDRALLDNVVTSCLVFEHGGKVSEYIGGYSDWFNYQTKQKTKHAPLKANVKKKAVQQQKASKPTKLSYMQQRELDCLPDEIADLEIEQEKLYTVLSDPEVLANSPDKVREAKKTLEDIESKLNNAFERWETLEALKH